MATETLMTGKEAARLLRYSHRSLEGMRLRGEGPRYERLPNGHVRYRPAALDEWVRDGRP